MTRTKLLERLEEIVESKKAAKHFINVKADEINFLKGEADRILKQLHFVPQGYTWRDSANAIQLFKIFKEEK